MTGISTQCLANFIFSSKFTYISAADLYPAWWRIWLHHLIWNRIRNQILYSQSGIHWILKLRHWFKYLKRHNLILNSYLLFSSTRVSYRYHLAHRTYTGELEQRQTLYISLPESHRLIRIKNLENPTPVDRYGCRIIDCIRQFCGSGIPSRFWIKYYETCGNMIWFFLSRIRIFSLPGYWIQGSK